MGLFDKFKQGLSKTKGKMDAKYPTDYARIALAVTALGYDASNVGGYDLLEPLQNVKSVAAQGVNGPIYALLALDSAGYPSDVRQDYVQAILDAQGSDGGYTWTPDAASDPDVTAMAVQALAPYMDQQKVGIAVENALMCLSTMQQKDGGFVSWGSANCESAAQVILALNAAGVSLDNEYFVKNGKTVLDNLMTFRMDDGSFRHEKTDENGSAYTSEQALRALVAIQHDDLAFFIVR